MSELVGILEEVTGGGYKIPFDKLSDEEKDAFIYPVYYEKVLNE